MVAALMGVRAVLPALVSADESLVMSVKDNLSCPFSETSQRTSSKSHL